MKNLFFITISVAASLGPVSAKAQDMDSTKSELSASTTKSKKQPKFIDNIELTPQSPSADNDNTSESVMPAKKAAKSIAKNTAISLSASSAAEESYLENCSSLQFKYAILTDQEVELVKDTALYSFIDSWIGTPYAYGGSTKDGIDCSSFTCRLMNDIFNLSIPRTAKEQYDACVRVHKENLREGDLVFFSTEGSRRGVSHVGVYLGNDYFVHSSTSSGVMISNLDEDYFSTRFISGGRLN